MSRALDFNIWIYWLIFEFINKFKIAQEKIIPFHTYLIAHNNRQTVDSRKEFPVICLPHIFMDSSNVQILDNNESNLGDEFTAPRRVAITARPAQDTNLDIT